MKAIWNDMVIAESDDTVLVENNHYFPMASLNRDVVVENTHHTTCPWKGVASYFTLRVKGQDNPNAAWYYPSPKKGAEAVTDRVAFWKGVQVAR